MLIESTSAAIGIKYSNTEILAITVDLGGNPANAGAILQAKYHTVKDIKELLDLGKLVILGENACPTSNKEHVYIIKNGKEWADLIQPKTTVAWYRDVQIYRNGIYKPRRKIEVQPYRCVATLDYVTEVDCSYLYNVKTQNWETYVKGVRLGQPQYLPNINYTGYITNLLVKEELSDLTRGQKHWLSEKGINIKY